MHRENGLPVVKVLSAYNSWKLEHYEKQAGAAVRLLRLNCIQLFYICMSQNELQTQTVTKTRPEQSIYARCFHATNYENQSLEERSGTKSAAFLRLTCLINGQPEPFRLLYFMRGWFVTFCQDRHKREMSLVDDTYGKHWRDIIGALYGQRLGRVFMHYALRSADWAQNIDGCSQRWREEHRNTIPPNPNPQNIRIKMIHLRKTPWQWIKK